MWLEADACGVADREISVLRELRLLESIACRIDADRRKIHAGRPGHAGLDELEQQAPAPASKLEHCLADRVLGQERISETLRDEIEV